MTTPSFSTESPADLLLSRLTGVRGRGHGSWTARCPAHQDRSPSLSLRETTDGTLLLKCFAGCSVPDIVAAVGLEVSDLFPRDRDDDDGPRRKVRAPPFPWREAIKALRHHLLVVQIGAAQLAAGDDLSEEDLDALARAALYCYEMLEDPVHE